MLYIYSHNKHSKGCKNLAKALHIFRVKHNNSGFKGRNNKTVINWGSSVLSTEVSKCSIINRPEAVSIAQNKLSLFQLLSKYEQVSIPEFTSDIEVAKDWLDNGNTVVAREMLRASAGRGIKIVKDKNEIEYAPLYTKYVPKKEEYRVHIVAGKIIDVQKKGIKLDYPKEDINWQVRTHDKGFIYMRENIKVPEDVTKQALLAFNKTDLDFGAIDVIYNDKSSKAYVLEINTAPGLEGTTVQKYKEAFEIYK